MGLPDQRSRQSPRSTFLPLEKWLALFNYATAPVPLMELRGTKRAAKSIYLANTCYQLFDHWLEYQTPWKISINEISEEVMHLPT